ncbi:hypothetical protein ACFL35_03200 [Candidatus Riflebacteria bacterium]
MFKSFCLFLCLIITLFSWSIEVDGRIRRSRSLRKKGNGKKAKQASTKKKAADEKSKTAKQTKGKGKDKQKSEDAKDSEESEESEESLTLPERIILYRCPNCYFTRDNQGPCPDDNIECLEVMPGNEDPDLVRFEEAEKSIVEMDLIFFKKLIEKQKKEKRKKALKK